MTEPVKNWPSLVSTRLAACSFVVMCMFVYVLQPLFYKDKRRYALALQQEVIQSFYEREQSAFQPPPKSLYVFERSLFSSLHVFAALNCNAQEYALLQQQCDQMMATLHQDERFFIYVRTPASVCLHHVEQRRKSTDAYIDLSYLQTLEEKLDRLFLPKQQVYMVDGAGSKQDVLASVINVIDDIIRVKCGEKSLKMQDKK